MRYTATMSRPTTSTSTQMAGENIEISCMFEDKGHMWIGTTSEGVFNLKIDGHQVTHPIEKGNITSIYQDNSGELWIGSWEKELSG